MHVAWQRGGFATERLEARDLIWLSTLGAATRRRISLDAPLFAIDELAGFAWRPARDVVAAGIDEMLRLGCLELHEGGAEPLLGTTAEGHACLLGLMAAKLERPRALLGQVGVRLKLAYLDLLPANRRRQVLADLIADHEREIASLRLDLGPAWCGLPGRRWLAADDERLRHDLALLRQLLAEEIGRGVSVPCALARRA